MVTMFLFERPGFLKKEIAFATIIFIQATECFNCSVFLNGGFNLI